MITTFIYIFSSNFRGKINSILKFFINNHHSYSLLSAYLSFLLIIALTLKHTKNVRNTNCFTIFLRIKQFINTN